MNEWFSDVLGTACQLVFMPDDARRSVNPRFDNGEEIVSFADGYPLMLLGLATLDDLNMRLKANSVELPPRHRSGDTPPKQGGELYEPLPMNRFRPNLVVSGSAAFAEDDWERIRIGDAVFRSTKPCERCVITTVEQSRGEFDGKEPLRTLASYRMAKNAIPERYESLGVPPTAVLFGQNLIAETPGASIHVGYEVEVVG